MADTNIPNIPHEREDARRAGLMFFIAPKLCRRKHSPTIRYTAGGQCVACLSSTHKTWVADNADRKREIDHAYHSIPEVKMRAMQAQQKRRCDNPEKRRIYEQKRYAANPDPQLNRQAIWSKNNPEYGRARQATRRSRKKNAGGQYTPNDISEIKKLQSGKCAYCKVKLTKKLHVDHIMPLARGGTNERRNLQLLCAHCNLSKWSKHPIDFVQQRFGLLI